MAPYLLLLLPFLFSIQPSTSQLDDNTCGFGRPVIRFPFGLNHTAINAYPGFTLKCNNLSQTVLTLPHAGDFLVDDIDYVTQSIDIKDSKNCFPRHFLNGFNLAGSPYDVPEFYRTYSFVDCPTNFSSNSAGLRIVPCLSDKNHTTVAIPASRFSEFAQEVSSCTHFVLVPVPGASWSDESMRLVWDVPDCKSCEMRGGTCGFKAGGGNSGLEVGCSNLPHSGGLPVPRSAQYGIMLGAGVPGLVCIIGVACCLSGKLRAYSRRRRQPDADFSTSTAPQPSLIVSGLDGPTIESYPKTLLGESKRLPKPGDTTCPICLGEYQPKETLRTIPECNHFFHAECIDEWLKMNATCPLCRNSPEASSRSSPAWSLSLSSASSPSSSSISRR